MNDTKQRFTQTPSLDISNPNQLAWSKSKRQTGYRILLTILPLFVYTILACITTSFVLSYLDGRNFSTTHRDRRHDMPSAFTTHKSYTSVMTGAELTGLGSSKSWVPLQTDMTSTLSVLLAIMRFSLVMWCIDVTWKCIFILLERTGLNLFQLGGLIDYKILFWSGVPSKRSSKRFSSTLVNSKLAIALALLLPFPAYFSSPILTGSINWTPTYDYFATQGRSVTIRYYSSGSRWDEYNQSPDARDRVMDWASKYYYMFYPSNVGASIRRTIRSNLFPPINPGSIIPDTVMPYISFDNPKQIYKSEVPLDQLQALDPLNFRLNITTLPRQLKFLSPDPVLLLDGRWKPAQSTGRNSTPKFKDPPAGQVSRQLNTARLYTSNKSCSFEEAQYDVGSADGRFYCYQFFSVRVSMGLIVCSNCSAENNRILTAPENYRVDDANIRPDPLSDQVLWMMPQVMESIQDPGDAFLLTNGFWGLSELLLRRVYFASWSALTDFTFTDVRTTPGPFDVQAGHVYEAIPSTKAVVDRSRVYVWIALQALVLVATGILFAIQWHCKRPMTINTAMELIFMEKVEETQMYDRNRQSEPNATVIDSNTDENDNRKDELKLIHDPKLKRWRLVKRRSDSTRVGSFS